MPPGVNGMREWNRNSSVNFLKKGKAIQPAVLINANRFGKLGSTLKGVKFE